MSSRLTLGKKRAARIARVRATISGSALQPRLSVFRSNRAMHVQLIDDEKGVTLAAASTKELKKTAHGKSKTEAARLLGELLAKKAAERGITKATFDRRAYAYHGRVKALAEGARSGGLAI